MTSYRPDGWTIPVVREATYTPERECGPKRQWSLRQLGSSIRFLSMKTALRLTKWLSVVCVITALVLLGLRVYLAREDNSVSNGTPKLVCILLDRSAFSIPPNNSQILGAAGYFSNGTKQDLTHRVTWSSSDPKIAEVTSNGTVKAIAPGHALVTALLGNQGASSTVIVGAPELLGLAISPANVSVGPDQSISYQATGTYSDGTLRDLTRS